MSDLPDPAQEIRDLRQENERLRGALEEIRQLRTLYDDSGRIGAVAVQRAADALDGGSDQDFPTVLGFGPDDIKDLEHDRDRLWDALAGIDEEVSDSRLTKSEKLRRVKAALNREFHSKDILEISHD